MVVILLSVFCTVKGFAIDISESEEDLICRYILAAVGEEAPLVCKMAVADIVLNRLADGRFENSVTGVIFEEDGLLSLSSGGMTKAFPPAAIESTRHALGLARGGMDVTGGAVLFAKKDSTDALSTITFEAGAFVFGY